MVMKLEASWHEALKEEIQSPYVSELKDFLEKEKKEGKAIYPPSEEIFQAFLFTPFEKVKVVIVGQDPYHGAGQAHGLSFSVKEGIALPPSLKNIYKELKDDLGVIRNGGCLSGWAKQGVLLLNATLSVRSGEPKSHYGKGWERFTDSVVKKLVEKKDPIVFLLWGKSAQEKIIFSEKTHHLVLKAAHPSPYSVSGFLGCKHFSKTNQFLKERGHLEIDWSI